MPTNQHSVPVGTATSSPIAAESYAQPPEVRQLYIHIREKEKLAVDVTDPSSNRPFISDRDIRGYLTQGRIVSLLRALGLEPALVDDIHDRYLLVFSILNWIGMGAYIGYFTLHEILEDRYLPFPSRPDYWPHGCDFFPQFFEKKMRGRPAAPRFRQLLPRGVSPGR